VFHGVVLSILCAISYWLMTYIIARLLSVSRDDDLLGGMWAVVATVFTYRWSYAQSVSGALSRMAATGLSFALCFAYLLFFPFQFLGMAALIGIGAIVMSLLDREEDIITTGITTAVVMVVAAMSPDHAWQQPLLRTIDTITAYSTATQARVDALQQSFIAKGFDPVAALKQAYAVIKSVMQRDAFIMAFNDAFLVIAVGLLVSAAAIWIVKVPKSTSAQVPAH
jgi:hypothetical protein